MYYIDYRWSKVKRGLGYFAAQPIVYKDSANAIISKNMQWTLHPTECRFLNSREIMSLMGLPSDFDMVTNNLQQVTQNVPVCTAKDMTDQVIKFINGELPMTNYHFMKQNNLTQKTDKVDYKEVLLFDDINEDYSEVENLTFDTNEVLDNGNGCCLQYTYFD